CVIVSEPEGVQLSVAETGEIVGTGAWQFALAEAVVPAGQLTIGFSVSLTVTVNVQEAVLPAASVAVELTDVVPTGKVEPDAGLETIVTPGQLSVAVTVKFTTALHLPASFDLTMLAGQ